MKARIEIGDQGEAVLGPHRLSFEKEGDKWDGDGCDGGIGRNAVKSDQKWGKVIHRQGSRTHARLGESRLALLSANVDQQVGV